MSEIKEYVYCTGHGKPVTRATALRNKKPVGCWHLKGEKCFCECHSYKVVKK